MKAERLFRVLGLVDSELVEEAMPGPLFPGGAGQRWRPVWRWCAFWASAGG